jgi:hypothetical protein
MSASVSLSPPVDFGEISWQTTDANGVEWYCENLAGWSDLPETDAVLISRALDYGGYFSDTYYEGRVLTLSGAIVAPDQFSLQRALNALRSQHWQCLRASVPLAVSEVDGWKYLDVRAGKTPLGVTYISPLAVRVTIELFAAWPVKHNQVKTLTAQASSAGAGRTYPRGGPNPWWQYGASGSTGDMRPVNDGNAVVRPQFTITGPVVNPRIINADQGRMLRFNINLVAGDILGIDTDTHSVVLNQVGNRRYVLSADSAWFELLPGTNLIQYRSDSNSGSLTCYFTDGWW